MQMRHLASTFVLLSAIAAAGVARAAGVDPAQATPEQREQAQGHFLKAKGLYEKNDFKGALDEFRASFDVVASPNTELYIARTLRELGQPVDAYVEFGRTAAAAKQQEAADPRYAKAEQAATDERAALASKIGLVVLTIHNPTDATTVSVSGAPVARADWSTPVPVKPGDVDVEVDTPGSAPIHKKLSIAAGARAPVDVDAHPVVVAAPPPPPPPSHHGPSWMLPVAIAGAGVGVVGMIVFGIAGQSSNNTYSDLQKQCGNSPCPPSLADEVSRGKREQAIANVGLVVGLVGLAVGATFFTLWVLPHHGSSSASASLVVGPGSLGLAGTF
jgi:hypothetical protein